MKIRIKGKREFFMILKVFSIISVFLLVSTLTYATLIERGTTNWDIAFEDIWNVSHKNGTIIDNSSIIKAGNISFVETISWANVTKSEWITPSYILDVDDEDIETDLNTYVDIAGDVMTGGLFGVGINETFGNFSQQVNILGRVGIGTTSPLGLLHVATSDNLNLQYMEIARASTLGPTIVAYKARGDLTSKGAASDGDSLFDIQAYGYTAGSAYERGAQMIFAVDGTPGAGDMPGRITFSTAPDNSATVQERMRITNAGNVGIGTTTPATLLDVKGKANFTGNFSIMNASNTVFFVDNTSGRVGIGMNSPGVPLHIKGVNPQVRFERDTDTSQFQFTVGTSTAAISATYSTTGSYLPLTLLTSDTERLRITTGGNVGIGTTSPAQTLTVQGRVNISQNLTVNNSVLFVDGTSGSVGIGTTTPAEMMEIYNPSSTSEPKLQISAGTHDFAIGVETGGTLWGFSIWLEDESKGLVIDENGGVAIGSYATQGAGESAPADGLIVSGNVGINTTSPTKALHSIGEFNLSAAGVQRQVSVNATCVIIKGQTSTLEIC